LKTSSSDNFRVAPLIPDHEMLRLIGKGSYGEVWLARSVTGAMRAVKVVQRSDFQFDKTFEREFEGIRKFEPISRSHPGLVDVLHVGRNLDLGFYYCVMELGDDQVRGTEIIPELYVARTLSSDINQREDGRLKVDECVEAGANLAGGLDYLHQRGLTHRDVKPSNVIFVDGVAKLADIGLVATSGQRTFVGTEGFVPPEGPGAPSADIYSLGMVLYEVSTGNDRLEFPELPNRLPPESERPKWRALNAVVCKACSQKPKDRFARAGDFAQALRRIKSGKVRRKTLRGKVLRMMLWSGLLASLIMLSRHREFLEAVGREYDTLVERQDRGAGSGIAVVPPGGSGSISGGDQPPVNPLPVIPPVPKPETGDVKIVSDPGVEVWTVDGKLIDVINASGVKIFENLPIGEVRYVLKRKGYTSRSVTGTVRSDAVEGIPGRLEVFRPPVDGKPWTNRSGLEFAWVDNWHVARLPVTAGLFEEFNAQAVQEVPFFKALVEVPDPGLAGELDGVLVSRDGAKAFCNWLTRTSREVGYLTEQHDYVVNEFADAQVVGSGVPAGSEGADELVLLMIAIEETEYATVKFVSTPPGASIYEGGEMIGEAGKSLRLEPGERILSFKKPGYKSYPLAVELFAGDELEKDIVLEESGAAVLGKAWTNELGMKFVPLGNDLLIGAHEVRVKDYRVFTDSGRGEWQNSAPFEQGDDHPVVMVTLKSARVFCEWLTRRDLEQELLEPGYEYRLPKDLEWSRAAGLGVEDGQTPAARDGQTKDLFPWGAAWPPPAGVANLDEELPGWDDGFEKTAPVGSFRPNALGLFDLAGNVWEWIDEPYGGNRNLRDHGVVRGGCFSNSREINLLASCRNPVGPGFAGVLNGFRVVIAKSVDTGDN
jgi:serine/threonine protein kinase